MPSDVVVVVLICIASALAVGAVALAWQLWKETRP
jgi:hypothetical protein